MKRFGFVTWPRYENSPAHAAACLRLLANAGHDAREIQDQFLDLSFSIFTVFTIQLGARIWPHKGNSYVRHFRCSRRTQFCFDRAYFRMQIRSGCHRHCVPPLGFSVSVPHHRQHIIEWQNPRSFGRGTSFGSCPVASALLSSTAQAEFIRVCLSSVFRLVLWARARRTPSAFRSGRPCGTSPSALLKLNNLCQCQADGGDTKCA